MAAMKYACALLLLCLPALLSASERCANSYTDRIDTARMLQAAPATPLVETRRAKKVKTLSAWQRMILFEQQIL